MTMFSDAFDSGSWKRNQKRKLKRLSARIGQGLSEEKICWCVANDNLDICRNKGLNYLLRQKLSDLKTSTLCCLMRWGGDAVRDYVWLKLRQRNDLDNYKSFLFEYAGDWIKEWLENFLKAIRQFALC